ncbi:uncharacterized protein LOC129746008 [Uranotaenia lowii]|uniref:uncharacterized protein LOC129746008 n=1 Tax=Uranotaenia lowii TaxID=190385 RepID=UPI0024789640|nr:uncharacterized protein LOC129746008 [Uranotaenia lowii]
MTSSNDIGGGGGERERNGRSGHHHHHHHRSSNNNLNGSQSNIVGRRISNVSVNSMNNSNNNNNTNNMLNGYGHNNHNHNNNNNNNSNLQLDKEKDWDFKKSTKYPDSDDCESLPPPPPPEDDNYDFDDPPPPHHFHHHSHLNLNLDTPSPLPHLNGLVGNGGTMNHGLGHDSSPKKSRKHRNSSTSENNSPNGKSSGGGHHHQHRSNGLNGHKGHHHHHHHHHHRPSHHGTTKSSRADSVLSSDSDIRFTRRKLGDNQKCGCALIAGFLLILLFAGVIVYVGYTYLRPEPLPDRIFRARFRVIDGDYWTPDMADQSSQRFQTRSRDYRERINLIMRRSDLRDPYEGSEILALDGNEGEDVTLHFAMYFDPYAELVSAADLHSILMEEITAEHPKYLRNLTIDPTSLVIKEVLGQFDDIPGTSSSPLGGKDDVINEIATTVRPPRKCEPLKLSYCRSVGYNMTTYPNYFGHNSVEEVEADLISFRELVDAECFRQAFDFICRLLQPPCEYRRMEEPSPGRICRQYCQAFWSGCGDRLPVRFKKFLDCERFPESTGIQSCHSKPGCAVELQNNALSSRLCDGVADCPDLSDENTCTFCAYGAIYCGRGRICYPKNARCDGKQDCPDGSDEKDCLSISPQVTHLTFPAPIVPYRPRFFSEGYAVFSEKGTTGKLCSIGMETNEFVRTTVAESLCKALGYERVDFSEIRNDTEPNTSYVRVLDPRASEISFVRTTCQTKQSLYVSCGQLECGVQSALPNNGQNVGLSKMAAPGDWPWMVALFRADTHVCDGTLVSSDWVLTTESCFQGQAKATWIAIFGAVRLSSNAPWTQRRRIIGMVKSPVEGSTAALVRLETPIVYSDFVRPICLPDIPLKETIDRADSGVKPTPHAEKFSKTRAPKRRIKEYRQYFETPGDEDGTSEEYSEITESSRYQVNEFAVEFTDEGSQIPKAEAVGVIAGTKNPYPLPENSPQTNNYVSPLNYIGQSFQAPKSKPTLWTNCNTLGWSRQRDHLQRVQLKISDMKPCENISIATVNSMCTEAAYHKQDCSEEEFAGSPVLCLLPTERKWALVGVASWRIACAPNGVERPRMYDKITSNTQWIRETIAASV